MDIKNFKITVLTLQRVQLSFTVTDYTLTVSGFIEFIDKKTGKLKIFHGSRCEIEEVI